MLLYRVNNLSTHGSHGGSRRVIWVVGAWKVDTDEMLTHVFFSVFNVKDELLRDESKMLIHQQFVAC